MLFDQISDANLGRLPDVFKAFMPSVVQTDLAPEDFLPQLPGFVGEDNFNIIFDSPPESDTKVFRTPNGVAIVKTMKQSHANFMSPFSGYDARTSMGMRGVPFAYQNMFPVANPMEALLSFLYAMAQKQTLGEKVIDMHIKPKVSEQLGAATLSAIENFINTITSGSQEFLDPESKKKITVTINDMADQAAEMRNGKEASLNNMFLNTPHHAHKKTAMLKKAGLVQTSLLKLARNLKPYEKFSGMKSYINLLKAAMRHDSTITINNPALQKALLDKLSELIKGIPGMTEDSAHDLIFNTEREANKPQIVHVHGYPIDTAKFNKLTYEEASPALTKSVADMIFEDGKPSIKKLEDLFNLLLDSNKEPSKREEVQDRIITPIVEMFAPDENEKEDLLGEK